MSNSNSNVLAQSATELAVSGESEALWFSQLPVKLRNMSGVGAPIVTTNATMRLERVNLNKQSLFAQVKRDYNAKFTAISNDKRDRNCDIPTPVYDKIMTCINDFVNSQIARLTEGDWQVKKYDRGYAWSNTDEQYVEAANVKSELIIPLTHSKDYPIGPTQKRAAELRVEITEKKLNDLTNPKDGSGLRVYPDDHDLVVKAKKQFTIALERLDAINKEIAAQAKLLKA